MAFHDHLIRACMALTPAPLALSALECPPKLERSLRQRWHLDDDGRLYSRWTHTRD